MFWIHDSPLKKLITKSLNKDEKSFFSFSFFFHFMCVDRIASFFLHIYHACYVNESVWSGFFLLCLAWPPCESWPLHKPKVMLHVTTLKLKSFRIYFWVLTFDLLLLFWSVKVQATCKISPKQIFLKWASKNLVRLRAQLH